MLQNGVHPKIVSERWRHSKDERYVINKYNEQKTNVRHNDLHVYMYAFFYSYLSIAN